MRYWELKESIPEEDANDPRGQDQRNDPNAPVDVSKADANDLTATLTQGPPYPPEQMDGVRKMQSQLIKIGYSVGRTGVDGKYGPLTSKGVAAFKKDYNETGDGSELTGTALAKLAKVESGALPKVAKPTNSGNPKPFGGAELAELDFGGEQNEEAKAIAETFLGREMKEQEWNALVRATVAEASPDSKEQAAVMAVILNRSNNSKYPDGVMGVLTQKNQFQAVTGTPRNRAPSRNFSRPSSQQIASVVNAVINHLPNANKTWLNFTANNPRAYGAGTNIDFMYAMRQSPGAQVIEALFLETLLDQNYVGKVLIAHPNLPHDNVFARTVIYLYQDDRRTGTVGVITNKKSRFDIRSLASEKGVEFGDTSQFVYHGGPVNQHALVLLHTNDWQSTNTAGAGRKLCVSSDEFMIEKLNNGQQPTYWRLFGGMSSWKPGQLNAELAGEYPFQAENSWLIADAPEGLLFTTDGDKQWQNALSLSSNQLFAQYL